MEVIAEKKFDAARNVLPEILAWVEEQSSTCLSMKEAMRIQLAAEEAVVNVIDYAYAESGQEIEKTVDIKIGKIENMFVIQLVDNGKPFNPLVNIEADAAASLEERELGGWGRPFILKMTDKAEYVYDEDSKQNILKLYRQIK